MGELLAVTCDSCGEPMVPNVSTLDDDGCGWICLSPGCAELAAGELEAEDLVEAGVPEALAGRLTRLIAHYADEADAPARTRERAQDLERLRGHLLELGRLAETTTALAARLDDSLCISYHSDDSAEAQAAKRALTVVYALCANVRRIISDAQPGRRRRAGAAGVHGAPLTVTAWRVLLGAPAPPPRQMPPASES